MGKKNNLIIASVVVAMIISSFCYISTTCTYNKKINESQKEITETVTVDLQDYFGSYMDKSAMKVKTLDQTVSDLEEQITKTYITDEQLQNLTSAVIEQITPQVLKDLSSSNIENNKQAIIQLEEQLNKKVLEMIEGSDCLMDEADKQAMADAVALIVEANILKVVSENKTAEDNAISLLENSINDKIDKIKTTVSEYEARIRELESKIGNLQTDSADAEEVAKMENELYALKRNYEAFSINSSNTTTIIETKIDEKTSEIEGNIVELKNSLQDGLNAVHSEIDVLEADLINNMDALEKASATKTALEEQKQLLTDAIAAAEQAAKTKSDEDLKAAQEALSEAISAVGTDSSEALKNAEKSLKEMMDGDKKELSKVLEDAKNALEEQGNTIDKKIQDINAEISALNNSITELGLKVSTNENEISRINDNLTDNSEEISNLRSENTELEKNLTSTNDALTALSKRTDVDDATSAVSVAIEAAEASANKSAADALKQARSDIETAYASGDAAAIEVANEKAENLISSLEAEITSEIEANKTSIGNLNTTTTQLQSSIDSNYSAIADLQNDKVSKSDLNNGAETTYTFSGSGTDTTVTVSVP